MTNFDADIFSGRKGNNMSEYKHLRGLCLSYYSGIRHTYLRNDSVMGGHEKVIGK